MDSRAGVAIAWLERWQIPLYLLALVAGAAIGLTAPATAPAFEQTINPVLIALLYATFLSVPLTRLGQALRNGRFLAGLLVLNFALVPVLVYGLSRFVAHDQALLLGVLLVLLTPCIDYVIVFSGLAVLGREVGDT
ncbi:sodium bile acid symporter family protein [Knoellia remsis]|uniref:Sodium bile acid symporter family protein n=1 Tax=Knoellia remsis TaxID=407159 RepID=A0A2T0U0E3_9MICO|nr:sodium bile acid symporter family protein [Knoellia remsis]